MEYKVSENVSAALKAVTADAKVQEALQFMEDDQENIL